MEPNLRDALTPCPGCRREIALSLAKCPHCGADADKSSAFLSFRYSSGGGGMADQATAAFLRCQLPDPAQVSVDALLSKTDSITLCELVVRDRKGTFEPVVVIESPEKMAEFRAIFRISSAGGHLMTFHEHEIRCFAGDKLMDTLALVRPSVLRWNKQWKSDATIEDPDALANFFARLGYKNLRDEIDRSRDELARHERRYEQWRRTWEAAMPAGLGALVEDLCHEQNSSKSEVRQKALRILSKAFPSREAQVLALFQWYGHSLGPWSGYPSSEAAPEYLLDTFEHQEIIYAALRPDLSVNQIEGAARFFARQKNPDIPAELRRKLTEYVQSTGDTDKIQRAARLRIQ
jgi:hypothetical protein